MFLAGLAGGAVATVVLLACSGGSSGSGPLLGPDGAIISPGEEGGPGPTGSGSGTLLPGNGPEAQDFVARFCKLFSPCCPKYGYGSDEAKCQRIYGGGPATYFYDPVEGESCISGITDGIAKNPDWCRGPSTPSSCAEVWKAPTAAAVGSPCEGPNACLSSPEGPVKCAQGSTTSICQVVATGKPGEACNESDQSFVNSLPDPPVARLVSCKSADGLYCDSKSHVCTAEKPDGGSCVFNEDCAPSEWCLQSCVPRKVAGEPCGPDPKECADGFWCDTGTATCAAKLDDGVACTNPLACKHFCQSGTCKDVPSANIEYLLYCDHD
jgi:hypothetical protein